MKPFRPDPLARHVLRRAALCGLCAALTACTTIDDYRAMAPDARATDLCQRQPALRGLESDVAAAQGALGEVRQALDRGYRVHQRCETILEFTGVTVTDCQLKPGGGERCVEKRKEREREVCTDTPVPIDGGIESRRERALSAQLQDLTDRHAQAWAACHARAIRLTPEQAFAER